MGGISDVTPTARPRGTGSLDPTALAALSTPAATDAAPAAASVASDAGPEASGADASGLSLGSVVANGISALVPAGDPLPAPAPSTHTVDPKNLTAEDQNRFNLMQQIYQMTTDAATSSNQGTDVDITSKAGAVAKKSEPPKHHHGGLFGKIMSFVKKLLPVLTLISMFVPGLQFISLAIKIAQMAMKAYELIQALKTGNLSAILSSVASIAGSFAGPIGQLGELGSKGMAMLKDIKEGGLSGGLKAFGDLVGGDVGGILKTASSAVTAIEKGDVAALADLAGPALKLDDDTMSKLKDAVGVASAVVKKDAGKALDALGDFTGDDTLSDIGSLFDAAKSGDAGTMMSALKDTGILPDDVSKALSTVVPAAKKVSDAIATGDSGEILKALGDSVSSTDLSTLKSMATGDQASAVDSYLGMGGDALA